MKGLKNTDIRVVDFGSATFYHEHQKHPLCPNGTTVHRRKQKYFYHNRLDWDDSTSAGRYVRDTVNPEGKESQPFLFTKHQRYMLCDAEEHRQLFDLIESMLEYEPPSAARSPRR
ncbi:unnamed protein product [Ranitomeya imitator]|uniref:dual-specificity kinase n=1 Tax=Ranitomeya imitator TaxID=111125 RepID=A0ABN9L3X4_9NEOB|nr:unnamed protein product [Ranitomeya imitator]